MHEIIPPDQIKTRIERLGLSPSRLALLAGISHSTITRSILSGDSQGVGFRTLNKISTALVAREIELRDYLVALHPLPAVPRPKLGAAE